MSGILVMIIPKDNETFRTVENVSKATQRQIVITMTEQGKLKKGKKF